MTRICWWTSTSSKLRSELRNSHIHDTRSLCRIGLVIRVIRVIRCWSISRILLLMVI